MARVQFKESTPHYVPLLDRVVEPDEVVEVPDDAYESFVPPEEHRHEGHPWVEIESPAEKKKTAKKKASS